MKKLEGKNQSFSRVLNNSYVIKLLQTTSLSATEMAQRLKLSNATMSSIVKELLEESVIKVEKTTSVKGCGRKQVLYTLNENFGINLSVNISNYQAIISVANIKQEILDVDTLEVEKYNASSIYLILLRTTQLLMNEKYRSIPLKNIVISLPGRVNNSTGELMLSKQFEPELFKEKNFIMNAFQKQYPGTPIYIANDINIMAVAELTKGNLVNVDNAIFISIDTGIGGSLIINNKLFEGNQGYAGEFGLIKVEDNGKVDCVDEFVSLRSLSDKVERELGLKLGGSRTKLLEAYNQNDKAKDIVLHSADILGEAIRQLIEVLDISTVVIGGKAEYFGKDYLNHVKSQLKGLLYEPDVKFSSLGNDAKKIGATSVGIDWILKQVAKNNYNR